MMRPGPCVIDGARCTSCCQAIWIPLDRRKLLKKPALGDAGFIRRFWKPISWRRAKKRNPHLLVGTQKPERSSGAFWRCTVLTQAGCGDYAGRPRVCSDYPRYGASPAVFNRRIADVPPEYHPACTEWTPIPVVQLP